MKFNISVSEFSVIRSFTFLYLVKFHKNSERYQVTTKNALGCTGVMVRPLEEFTIPPALFFNKNLSYWHSRFLWKGYTLYKEEQVSQEGKWKVVPKQLNCEISCIHWASVKLSNHCGFIRHSNISQQMLWLWLLNNCQRIYAYLTKWEFKRASHHNKKNLKKK